MTTFQNPSDHDIQQLLQNIKNIAVVGLSPKPDRPSHEVAALMQGFGYCIIPVRPATDEILGEKVYSDLASVDKPIDLVNVFLNPSRVDALVDSCIELKLPTIWLQEGVVNESAALRAQQAGIQVIMDRCIYKDYIRLMGS
ncbi:MAG: CoA-binding protein [Gammaproteobacteria bacterium]|nr:CoA-binding protein [Gammaproteobacteria bacterium]